MKVEVKSLKIPEKMIGSMQVSLDPDFKQTEWFPFKEQPYSLKLDGADGDYLIYVRLKDTKDNISPTGQATILLDRKPPVNGEIQVNKGAAYTNDPQMKVRLDLKADDAIKMQINHNQDFNGISWEDYVEQKTIFLAPPGDGKKMIYARFMDLAQNISETVSTSIILDTAPPANCSININQGASFTRSNLVKVQIQARGASQVRLLDQKGKSEVFDFPSNQSEFEVNWTFESTEGPKAMRAYFIDEAQNKTSEIVQDQIVFDKTAPDPPQIIIDQGSKYTRQPDGKVKLQLRSAESPAGFHMLISHTASFESSQKLPFKPEIGSWQLDAAADGAKQVYVKLIDQAGNTSRAGEALIQLDRTVPEIVTFKIKGEKAWVNQPRIDLLIKADQAHMIQVTSRGPATSPDLPWRPFTEEIQDFQLTLEQGEKKIWARVKDEAGNISDWSRTAVRLDTEPPGGGLEIDHATKFTNHPDAKVSVQISAGDAVECRLSEDHQFQQTKWIKCIDAAAFWQFEGQDGPRRLFLQLKDQAGNISDPIVASIEVDRKAPEGKMLINNGLAWINQPNKRVTLSFMASEPVEMQISNDPAFTEARWMSFKSTLGWTLSGPEGLNKIFARFKDQAGNISDLIEDHINWDIQPPELESFSIAGGLDIINPTDLKADLQIDAPEAAFMYFSEEPIDLSVQNKITWIPFSAKYEWSFTPQEGAKSIFLVLKDSAGNVSEVYNDHVILDLTPPDSKLIVNMGQPYLTDTAKTVELMLGKSDAIQMMIGNEPGFNQQQWEQFSTRKTLILPGEDGKKTIFAKFRDQAGNESEVVSGSVWLDRQGPEVKNASLKKSAEEVLLLKITVKPPQDVQEMILAWQDDFTGSTWQPFKSETEVNIPEEKAVDRIFFKLKDKAGNVTGVETLKISD
ncbi:MAG: hypothetical protein ACNS62_17100 [Candidatus Cyclobacteriaceae bacterium M3_2C_046]